MFNNSFFKYTLSLHLTIIILESHLRVMKNTVSKGFLILLFIFAAKFLISCCDDMDRGIGKYSTLEIELADYSFGIQDHFLNEADTSYSDSLKVRAHFNLASVAFLKDFGFNSALATQKCAYYYSHIQSPIKSMTLVSNEDFLGRAKGSKLDSFAYALDYNNGSVQISIDSLRIKLNRENETSIPEWGSSFDIVLKEKPGHNLLHKYILKIELANGDLLEGETVSIVRL